MGVLHHLTAVAVTLTGVSAAPNIIVVLADDQGFGDVSYNAVPERQYQPGAGGTMWAPNPPRTPQLDAMANSADSLVFHRFYAASAVRVCGGLDSFGISTFVPTRAMTPRRRRPPPPARRARRWSRRRRCARLRARRR